jgi:HK97 gp10 family phage protein
VSAAFDVKLDGGDELIAALRRMDANVKAELRAAVSAGAEIVRDAANGLAPGPHMAMQVVKATASVVEVDIGPKAEKWFYRFFETGAAPHEIRGRALLAFQGEQGLVVTPGVSHPGIGASPFLRPALDANESAATDEIGAKLRSTIEAGS